MERSKRSLTVRMKHEDELWDEQRLKLEPVRPLSQCSVQSCEQGTLQQTRTTLTTRKRHYKQAQLCFRPQCSRVIS